MVGQCERRSRRSYQRAAAAVGWSLIVGLVVGFTAVTQGGGKASAGSAGGAGPYERGAALAATAAGDPVTPVAVDQAGEVPLAPPLRLPHLGPRYAPVTFDLFIGVGQKGGEINLGLALRRVRAEPDVRLVLHPVTTGPLAERGAEVIWEAFEQQPARWYGFIHQLFNHPDWLAVTSEGEEALLTAAGAAGLDPQRLRSALYSHRHRATVTALWQAVREQVAYPPELWINGRHLRGTLTDAQLREELDRQRSRAQRAIQGGTPLTRLYERLVADENSERPEDSGPVPGRPWGRVTLSLPPRPVATPLPSHLDLSSVPSRGPRIAPVTLVLIGSLDSAGMYGVARAANEVWSRHPDSLRLVFLQAPNNNTSQRIALLLAQVALVDEERFWRLFDGILRVLPWRFPLRYQEVESLVRREGGFALIEDGLRTKAAEGRLQHDVEQARRLGIEYTPVVLVNGLAVRGSPLVEALESAIEREQKRGLLQRLHSPPPRPDAGWLVR